MNQLLDSKEFKPPEAVIFKAGYIDAFAIPTFAFEAFKANSAFFTSGRLLTKEAGIPAFKSSCKPIAFNVVFRSFLLGKLPVITLKAFS